MEQKEYRSYIFENAPEWKNVPEEYLEFANWDSKVHYETYFKMCLVKNKGIYVQMRTNETKLRIENTVTNGNIWEDSCMEFFFCPFMHRDEYLNFEMNPNGVYLCQYGKDKYSRIFLSEKTSVEPEIKTCINSEGWSLELFVPEKLISEAYNETYTARGGLFKGNFYKCGDLTEKHHYDSFSKMSTLPPGFHNPECFAKIYISER